jgi:hypothetical protein
LILAGCSFVDDDGTLEEHEESGVSDAGDTGESTAAPTHDPTGPNCPGGSGGGDQSGGPGDQPQRKKCSKDHGLEKCLDCCYYNHDHVDGWKCRGIKGNSPAQRAKRKRCWEDAANELGRCQVQDCGRDRPVITTATGWLP